MTTTITEQIVERHPLVVSDRRRVEFVLRRFIVDGRDSVTVQLREERAGSPRPYTVDFQVTALDDAIAALCSIRAKVVGEFGAGATQRRDAQPHGTWSPNTATNERHTK